ncbi:MAG: ComEC/Rec2 family competence protein [bacterium]
MSSVLSLAVRGIDNVFHEPYASLMKGLVYGLPIRIDPTLKQEIVKSGLAHLVVLSGANVTLLTQFSEKLFSSVSKKMGIILQLLFLGIFVSIVGPQAPLMRAVYMFICTVVCILTGRPSLMGWNLFLTIILVACIHPIWITSISFQLSVCATIGIIIWGFIASRFEKIHPLAEVFFESWIVFLATSPVSIWYFKSISLMSPFGTALVSWLIVPLMVAGFAISLTHLLFPSLALLIAIPTQMGLQFIISIIHITSRLPGGYLLLQ